MDRNFERAYVHRACCKFELEDYKGSLEDFKTAIALNPRDHLTYMNAGIAKYYLDENSKDFSYFSKVIKMNPKESSAYFMKGLILKNNVHSYKTALTSFNKAIELEQDYYKYYLHRAECYRYLKRYDNALADYKKALKLGEKALKKSKSNTERLNSGTMYCKNASKQASLKNS